MVGGAALALVEQRPQSCPEPVQLPLQLLELLEQLQGLVAGESTLVGAEHGDRAVKDDQLMPEVHRRISNTSSYRGRKKPGPSSPATSITFYRGPAGRPGRSGDSPAAGGAGGGRLGRAVPVGRHGLPIEEPALQLSFRDRRQASDLANASDGAFSEP
jgi:hypothetical protein